MTVSNTGINQYTTQRGNTLYFGSGTVSNDAGTRSATRGGIAIDRGSDGTIDGAAGYGVASGPNGQAAVFGAANQNGAVAIGGFRGANGHSGLGLAATNYESAQVWKRFA